MLLDYCLISILLLLSHLLRFKSGLLQRIYLPTPIIAGLLGLIGGEQFLAILPFHHQEDGSLTLATYPSILISLLFATLFMGGKKKLVPARVALHRAGDTFFYNLASELGQYAVALTFGIVLLAPLFPELNPGFSLLLPAGFVGGHGTVTAMAQVLQEDGWSDALTVGYTFATVGMLSGIVGGMLLINLGANRGWTRLVRTADELPASLRKGFVPEDERRSIGSETVSPLALDPLSWHIALVLAAFGIAYFADAQIRSTFGKHLALPMFALALLAGALLQKSLDAVGLGGYVDRPIMERIGSTVSDFLVAFGVASIKIHVVVQHAVPMAIMCALGVAYSVGLFWFVGRRMFHNFWFERSIFVYGWNTGVVGIGIALLRVVDPRLRSKTLEDFGLAYVGISLIAIAIIVTLPQLVVRGYVGIPAAVLGAAFVLCLVISRYLFGWSAAGADQIRPGENEAEPAADQS
jgi:ESS family glutamate:Na+ symporter